MKPTPQDLEQYPLLRVLSDEERRQICDMIRVDALEKNGVLFLEGEFSSALFFVISGWLKAEKVSREGRQQILRFIGPGEMINELSVFSNEANAVSVIALEPCQVFSLSQADVEKLLEQSPSFSRAVIKNLAHRIDYLLTKIENLSLYTVEVRLARFLLEHEESGVVLRQSWKTQSEIAAQIGTVPDVLNRHLQKFARDGVIDISREQIRIIDMQALEQFARG